MQLYDVCTRRVYEKDGERKVKWYKAGMLKEGDNGKKYIRLFHSPQVEYFIFNREPLPLEQKDTEDK